MPPVRCWSASGRGIFPEWVTLGEPGDFGTLLLELFAHASDVMHFYIDRVGSRRSSAPPSCAGACPIADQFGYTPIGQQAARHPAGPLGADEAIFTIPAGDPGEQLRRDPGHVRDRHGRPSSRPARHPTSGHRGAHLSPGASLGLSRASPTPSSSSPTRGHLLHGRHPDAGGRQLVD